MKTMPSQYLTMHQALELRNSHAEQVSELRLALFNSFRHATPKVIHRVFSLSGSAHGRCSAAATLE